MKKIDQLRIYLLKHGSITKMIAADKFNIYGLSEQISRLRMKGYNIETEMIARPGRQAYARYILINE